MNIDILSAHKLRFVIPFLRIVSDCFILYLYQRELNRKLNISKKSRLKKIVQLSTISQYNALAQTDYNHQLVTILDMSKGQMLPIDTYNYGVYGIYLIEGACGDLKYGRNYYTHEQNSLGFTAPGQVMTNSFDWDIHE